MALKDADLTSLEIKVLMHLKRDRSNPEWDKMTLARFKELYECHIELPEDNRDKEYIKHLIKGNLK